LTATRTNFPSRDRTLRQTTSNITYMITITLILIGLVVVTSVDSAEPNRGD
jgi:hypothetical protein